MKIIRIIRKVVQLLFLGLFVYLLGVNRYPLNFFLPTDFFLRIDPLAGMAVIVAGRELAVRFWPAIITIVSAVILGRFFCGWVCPLGTTLDLSDRVIKPPAGDKEKVHFPYLKYMILILVVIGAILSFQFIFFLDPLVIITRSATITLYPIFYHLLEGSLAGMAHSPVVGGWFFDLYSSLKGNLIPVQEQIFRQGLPILAIFLGILLLEKLSRRFWCRNLCPLGALLGFLGKFSPFGRRVDGDTCTECGECATDCKMGAIDEENFKSSRAECILCLNCWFPCPSEAIHFSFNRQEKGDSALDIDRRRFLTAAGSGLILLGLYRTTPVDIDRSEKNIRPPGAVEEDKFLDLCLRCQQCTGICSTTGGCLQPAVSEAGLEGLWTPVARMREGYCEFNCNLCGQVCPSGAIKPLELAEKQKRVMGRAFFDKNRCIPYYREEDCLVCEEHCPTPDKAIKFREKSIIKDGVSRILKEPYVVEDLCIGCGICETKCPVDGKSAIFVTREGEQRGEEVDG